MSGLFSIVEGFFAEFSRLKLFLLVFVFSLVAVLLSFKLSGFSATAWVLIPALLSILQITKGVWSPEGGGKSSVGLASLGVAILAISSNKTWRPFAESLLSPLLAKYPSLNDRLPSDSPSILGLLFLTLVILIVNYFTRDTTAMKEHPTPLEKEFPEKEYRHYLKSFCGILLDDLNRVDRETNWSAEVFTPLDAEVEIQSGLKRLKRISDLLRAIRSDRSSKVFLVLGDPGSGKSVALRKLCRDLLREVDMTGRVPVYINLREWEPARTWSESQPPTGEELYDFVFENLKDRGDIFTKEFLDKYFKKMFEHGRLFVVLDSFDEIPAVLDVDERSWLIDKLSEVIYRFLAGAHESRGVLASRVYRRPTRSFDAKTILAIRPFTEVKIVETLRKSLSYDESLIKLLFNQRQEFIPIARNPFTAALISSFAKQHHNTLPLTQSELYSSYINHRLEACKDKIESKGLTVVKVIESSIKIAHVMLTTEALGLEAPIKHLEESLPGEPILDVAHILRYARLGRLGSGDERRFSFVHRRFNEYFVVQKLRQNPETVPFDAIPTDSRWRDALVLYCEIAEEKHASLIARSCWLEVKNIAKAERNLAEPQYLRAVHCLRFLRDAFRSRLHLIGPFRSKLASVIDAELLQGSILSKKIAVEAVGLLKPKRIDAVLIRALKINNRWVNEIAFRSCHYLPRLSPYLTRRLMLYLDTIDMWSFMKRRRELMLSLTLSNVFSHLKRFCYWRIVDIFCFLGALVIYSFLTKGVLLVVVFLGLFVHLLARKLREAGQLNLVVDVRNLLAILIGPLGAVFLILLVLTPPKRGIPIGLMPSLAIGTFLVIPWYRIWHFSVPWWIELPKPEFSIKALKRVRIDLISSGILLAVLAGMSIIAAGIIGAFNYFPRTSTTVLGVAIFAGLVAGILRISRYIVKVWRDRNRMLGAARSNIVTREQITHQFLQFETPRGRLKFARFLEFQKLNPSGSWVAGVLPNIDDDEASTVLAQLEEKWLGLDR